MKEVYLGIIVNTHGIKGEVRILSDFKYKNLVFIPGFKLYIGKTRKEVIINSYRKHKNFDMVTFKGISDINDVLGYKGKSVYINRDDIVVDGYINEDIVGFEVYSNDTLIGNALEVINNGAHDILVISGKEKRHMIPFIDEFIDHVDIENHKIYINEIEGLLNED